MAKAKKPNPFAKKPKGKGKMPPSDMPKGKRGC